MKTEKIELAELSLESVDVQNKHQALLLKRKLIEAELSALKSRVRGANTHKTRLSNENYRQITNRQAVLAKKMAEIDVAVAPLKARLREIGALSTLHYATRTDATATDSNKAVIPSGNSQMRIAIVSLRGKWLDFAEDQTRVNSMRVMAAQFSRELTDLLAATSIDAP